MEDLHHLGAGKSDFVIHLDFCQELLCHGLEGIWWPFREPIDGRAVDDGWEISDSVSERGTNRREAKDNVKVLLASFQEIRKELSRGSLWASLFFLGWTSHQLTDIGLLISWENVGHLTSVENIVDILKETFLLDLSIGEKE